MKVPLNYKQNDYLFFSVICFSTFLAMYGTNLKQFDLTKNKQFEIMNRKLWKSIAEKRNKFMKVLTLLKKNHKNDC
jgi:hypothetical protein